MRPKILWLPSPSSEGYASMDRYWRELTRQLTLSRFENFGVYCPFGEPPLRSQKALRLVRAWNKYFWLPWKLRGQRGFDIAHVLDHSCTHFLRHLPSSTLKVVTVHDLAPLEDPDRLTRAQLRRFHVTIANMKQVNLILCDSEYSARAARKFLDRDRDIYVLPLGVDPGSFSRHRSLNLGPNLPSCPKILSVGSNLLRKNLRILPELLQAVRNALGPVALIRVGERLDAELLARLRQALQSENVIELGACSDEDLAALYQNVDLLLIPSTLEGFGLPILEAMAAGCPVVSSNASSLPEVGGDDALYFDPALPAEGARQTIRLLTEPQLRSRLIDAGKARALRFSWAKHAEKLVEFYGQILKHSADQSPEACGAR